MSRRAKPLPWLGVALCLPALLPVLALCVHLASDVWAALHRYGVAHLLVWEWRPDAGQFGLARLVLATLMAAILAMLMWLPLGLGTACWLGIFAPARSRRMGEIALGMLASVPTTVAGLIVAALLVPVTNVGFAPVAVVLALLQLPLFASGAAAAIRQRADEIRLAAEALGLPPGAVCGIIVSAARRGILSAALAAFGKSCGEALAVRMVADLSGPSATLGAILAADHSNPSAEHTAMLALVTLALFCVVLALSFSVRRIEEVQPR